MVSLSHARTHTHMRAHKQWQTNIKTIRQLYFSGATIQRKEIFRATPTPHTHTHTLPAQTLWWQSMAGNIWMYFRGVYISKMSKNCTERKYERQNFEKHCRCQMGNKKKPNWKLMSARKYLRSSIKRWLNVGLSELRPYSDPKHSGQSVLIGRSAEVLPKLRCLESFLPHLLLTSWQPLLRT